MAIHFYPLMQNLEAKQYMEAVKMHSMNCRRNKYDNRLRQRLTSRPTKVWLRQQYKSQCEFA